jgi:hypothetical protein
VLVLLLGLGVLVWGVFVGLLGERIYNIPGIRHSKSSFVLRTLKKVDTPLT